jgi:thioredoxin reductase (NADPH)
VEQARRFDVEIVAARGRGIRVEGPYRVLTLDDETEIFCRTVLLAMGVNWRTLDAPGCQALVGAGVYYGAASAEASAVRGQDVYLLGRRELCRSGGAPPGALRPLVTMLVLEESIEENMSSYLLDRIDGSSNIEVRSCCTISNAAATSGSST